MAMKQAAETVSGPVSGPVSGRAMGLASATPVQQDDGNAERGATTSQRRRRRARLLLTGATPLDALLPSWLLALQAANAPATTRATYRIGVERFMTYLRIEGRSLRAGEVLREDVQGFVLKLHELEYAPSTARLWLVAVQSFCGWLVEQGELATSPATQIRAPQLPERLTRTLTEDEARRLIAACRSDTYNPFNARRDEALVRLALDSGLREAELASLRLEDIDLMARVARVVGKGDRERIVGFGVKTAAAIDRYLRARRAHRYATLPWLWLGHRGRFGKQGIYLAVVTRGELAGLGHVRPHMLRHTWADLCLRNGMQQHDLKQLGGWKSDTTMWRYGASLRGERAIAAHKQFGPGDRL